MTEWYRTLKQGITTSYHTPFISLCITILQTYSMLHDTGYKHIINSGTNQSLHLNVHTMWSDYTITEAKLPDQNKQLFQFN